MKQLYSYIAIGLLTLSGPLVLRANPTGGHVAAGSAQIAGQGTSAVTIQQASNTAIINWQTFSINSGESTQFLQPSSTSAALNRVLGGQTSIINGTLSANGQIYLINGNGIIVGPGGVVTANGFTASTRDISDTDFLNGNLHFAGSGNAGVQNLGTITALGGDVVLIGKTVDNQGTITASQGTTGLVAADDVLLGQRNADGSTITVSPSSLASNAGGTVGVHNSGTITAAAAELKAANGNIYALAIQNEGIVRATTVHKQGGHIWLTSDSGAIVNTGMLNASATAAKGHGGTVTMKNMGGTTIDNGAILAKGGRGGAGGNAEVSGDVVQFSGTVDLSALGGTTGNLLFDPENVIIQTAGTTTATSSGTPVNTYTGAVDNTILTVADLEAALANASITITTGSTGTQSGDITVANALTWVNANTLTLTAANNIYLNADITAASGGLTLSAVHNITSGTEAAPSAAGVTVNINVANFILQKGSWTQNSATLPTFTATSNFEVQAGTFLRVEGGSGSTANPYQLVDVYGLQGISSPSGNLLSKSFVLENNIDASGTATWNPAGSPVVDAGFSPIGISNYPLPYTGTFNGAGYTISGLTIDRPSQLHVGLFAATGTGAVLENVALVGGSVIGSEFVGGLVGINDGTVETSYATGTVNGSEYVGGLVGYNSEGTVETSYATGVVTGSSSYSYVGGLVGYNGGGLVETSYASGTVSGPSYIGGLVGDNNAGTVETSYATGAVSGASEVGGLVGFNQGGTVETSYASGGVAGNSGSYYVGGLVGLNQDGTVETSYASGGVAGNSGSYYVGGLVGLNQDGTVETSYATGTVSGSYYIGGLVGDSEDGTVETSYASGGVTGTAIVGGLVGLIDGGTVETSYATGTVSGDEEVGGLVGHTTGTVETSYWLQDTGINQGLDGVGYDSNTSGPDNIGAAPETLAQLMTESTFDTNSTHAGYWDFTQTWTFGPGTTPLLQTLSTTLSGTTPGATDSVDLIGAGGVLYTTTAGSHSYSLLVPDNIVTSGALLTDVTGTPAADTYYIAGVIPGATIPGVNLTGNLLSVLGTGVASNTGLGAAAGALNTATYGINYTVSATPTLTTASGVSMTIGSSYALDGNIMVGTGGALATTSSGALTGSANVTLSAATMNFAGSLNDTATVTFNSSGAIADTGAVSVGGFILQNGSWSQDSATLPAFSATNDFELQNSSTFLRVAGGNGSTASPYQLVDVYGLQGIGSPSGSLLGDSFVLNNNIDASGTATWNPTGPPGVDAGFSPIGTHIPIDYTGTFNGAGYTISGLTIYRPGQQYVGLFGELRATGANGVLENVALVGGSVNGSTEVGGLLGFNFGGTVQTSYTTGAVSGTNNVGGLVGENEGTVETSYATGAVNGANKVGGLVGLNEDTVETSYATGAVTGGNNAIYVGGLVGYNVGTVETSYWLQDTGINTGLFGIGSSSSNSGATPETLAALQQQATFRPTGTGPANWNFTPGTGVWAINGYTSNGLVNNGLPYFQWQYPTIQIIAANQTTTYNKTNTGDGYSSSDFTVAGLGGGSLSSFITGSPVLSISGANVNVGTTDTIVISATPSSPTNAVELVNGTESFTARPITVSATDLTNPGTTYGNTPGFANNGQSQVLSGDTLGGTVSYSNTDGTSSAGFLNAGTFSYTPLITGYNSNYNVTYNAAGFTVNPKAITVSATDLTSPGTTYGNTPSFANNGQSQVLSGDVLGGTVSYSNTDALSPAGYLNAGTFSYTPSISGANSNYSVTYNAANFTINPKAITVSATDLTNPGTTYGNTPSFANNGQSQVLSGDVLGGTVSYNNSDALSPAGYLNAGTFSYTPLITGYNSNYNVTYNAAGFTVNPKAITVSATDLTSPGTTYGNTPGFANNGQSQVLSGDTLGGTVSYTNTDALSTAGYLNAGTFSYTPSISGYNSNYAVTYNSANFTVNPKAITVGAVDLTNPGTTYGNTPGFANNGQSQVLSGDVLGGTVSYSNTDALSTAGYLNAGTFSYTPSISGANSNYSVTYNAANFTITPKNITILPDGNQGKVYGTTDPALTYTTLPGAILTGDTLTGTLNYANAGQYTNVGDYAFGLGTLANANYHLVLQNGAPTFAITPATLTYVANPATRRVGQSDPAFTGTVTGFLGTDTQTNATGGISVFTTTATDSSPAGSYTINGSGLTANHGNYIFAQAPGNAMALTIAGYLLGQPGNPFFNFSAQFDSNAAYPGFFTQGQFWLFNPDLNAWLVPVFDEGNAPLKVYWNKPPEYGGEDKSPKKVISFGSSYLYFGSTEGGQ